MRPTPGPEDRERKCGVSGAWLGGASYHGAQPEGWMRDLTRVIAKIGSLVQASAKDTTRVLYRYMRQETPICAPVSGPCYSTLHRAQPRRGPELLGDDRRVLVLWHPHHTALVLTSNAGRRVRDFSSSPTHFEACNLALVNLFYYRIPASYDTSHSSVTA